MADQATQPAPVALNLAGHVLPEDALALANLNSDSGTDTEADSGAGNRSFELLEMMMNRIKTDVDFSEDDAQFEGMNPTEARVRAMEIAHELTAGEGEIVEVDTSGAPARLIFECMTHLFEHEKRERKRIQEKEEEIKHARKMLKKARKCLDEQVARHQAQLEQEQADGQ